MNPFDTFTLVLLLLIFLFSIFVLLDITPVDTCLATSQYCKLARMPRQYRTPKATHSATHPRLQAQKSATARKSSIRAARAIERQVSSIPKSQTIVTGEDRYRPDTRTVDLYSGESRQAKDRPQNQEEGQARQYVDTPCPLVHLFVLTDVIFQIMPYAISTSSKELFTLSSLNQLSTV